MKAKVEVKSFVDYSEGGKWLEAYLQREDMKIFHILQSIHDSELTYTVVYAEMITAENLSEKIKEAQENKKEG